MQVVLAGLDQKSHHQEVFMTRTRDFHRFQRWTAKQRRRSLRNVLPEAREGERHPLHTVNDLRCREWQLDQLHDLIEHDGREESAC